MPYFIVDMKKCMVCFIRLVYIFVCLHFYIFSLSAFHVEISLPSIPFLWVYLWCNLKIIFIRYRFIFRIIFFWYVYRIRMDAMNWAGGERMSLWKWVGSPDGWMGFRYKEKGKIKALRKNIDETISH